MSANDASARSIWPLFVLLLVFLAPLLLAWWLARHPEQAGAGASYGVLITPPRPVPNQDLQAMPTRPDSGGQRSRPMPTPNQDLRAMPTWPDSGRPRSRPMSNQDLQTMPPAPPHHSQASGSAPGQDLRAMPTPQLDNAKRRSASGLEDLQPMPPGPDSGRQRSMPMPNQDLQAMPTAPPHHSQASGSAPGQDLQAMPTGGAGMMASLPAPRVLHGRWSLVYLVPVPCAQDCRRALYLLHQIEQALGKDSLRVQRIVHQAPGSDAPAWPGQWRLVRPDALLSRLHTLRAQGRIYLIDPLGNLMMYYPQDFAPEGLIGDLRRLLKVSRTG